MIPFLIASMGATAIILRGSIFAGLRRSWYSRFAKKPSTAFLAVFFTCALCVGFWVGVAFSLILGGVSGNIFVDACMSSGICWAAFLIEHSLTKPGGGCAGCGKK
jgi:hypothetical protein